MVPVVRRRHHWRGKMLPTTGNVGSFTRTTAPRRLVVPRAQSPTIAMAAAFGSRPRRFGARQGGPALRT